ncbi:MAG: hypothetical protein V4485_06135 [Pseudomonadota bacterium]
MSSGIIAVMIEQKIKGVMVVLKGFARFSLQGSIATLARLHYYRLSSA